MNNNCAYCAASQDVEAELELQLSSAYNEIEILQNKLDKKVIIFNKIILETNQHNKKLNEEIITLQLNNNQLNNKNHNLLEKQRQFEQDIDDLQRKNRILSHENMELEEKFNILEEDFIILSEEMNEMKTQHLKIRQNYERKIQDLEDYTPNITPIRSNLQQTPLLLNNTTNNIENNNLTSVLFNQHSNIHDMSMNSLPDGENYHSPISKTPIRKRIAPNTAPRENLLSPHHRSLSDLLHNNNNLHHNHHPAFPKLLRMLSSPPQSLDKLNEVSYHKMPFEKHIHKRYLFVLYAGHNFKKIAYRHSIATKRWIWVSKTLDRICWGICGDTIRIVRGFIMSNEIIEVGSGSGHGGLDKKIYLFTQQKQRTLELEAPDLITHRDFLGAFKHLLTYHQQQQKIFENIQLNVLTKLLEKHKSMSNILKNECLVNLILILNNNEKQIKRRIMKFSDSLDCIEWYNNDKSNQICEKILYTDLCDFVDVVMNYPLGVELRAIRKSFIIEFNNEKEKKLFIDALTHMKLYFQHLCSHL